MSDAALPLLRVHKLVKQFPGVKALKGVSLELGRGEVLAVIGENGAGKSTLMKILAGVQQADSGTVALDGEVVTVRSVRDATARGIALIHQELNLADNLDVGANIFLGREPRKWGGLVLDRKTIARESERYLAQVGLKVSPHLLVSRLSIGHQQLVEIAKALSIDARILIMDEPTSSLSQGEAEDLYRVIDSLRDRGVSVIYISHRLGEVKRVADRVVVLRDGENAGELSRSEIHHDAMVRLMVGRDLERRHRQVVEPDAAPILTVQGLCTQAFPKSPVSFSVRPGEVVGIAGLVGAGRTEILQAIFGAVPAVSGEIAIGAEVFRPEKPLDAMEAGIALVPEDRKQQGLILQAGIRDNVLLASLPWAQRLGFVARPRARELSAEAIERLNIKTPNDMQLVQLLSGGNQQKVVLGKWLGIKPRILLLDEPTRGIDVGAKGEIYRIMEALAAEGVAILFVSSEMEEVLNMADRVLVVHEGAITGELSHAECTEERIMQCATGQSAA